MARRSLGEGDARCHPALGQLLAKLLRCGTGARARWDAPGHGQFSGEGPPCSSWAGRWGWTCLLPLSQSRSPPQPLHLHAMRPRSPAGLVHGVGVTRCNFHALDTNIFVWLLPRHLNMSAVPSTDSCAVSSPPTSIQTASRGCWLFPACLRSVAGTGAGSPDTRKRLLGLSGRLPPMPSERSK